jgi:hypothetical protein
MSPSFAPCPTFASRSHPLITIAAITMEACCEAGLGRGLWGDVRRGTTRSVCLDAWSQSLLRHALPHLFTQLCALLPSSLPLLEALQLAVLGTCQPSLSRALLESLLHFLRAPIDPLLTPLRAALRRRLSCLLPHLRVPLSPCPLRLQDLGAMMFTPQRALG